MKAGTENRKKTMAAAGLGVVVLLMAMYAYHSLYGGSSSPEPAAQPAATNRNAVAGTMTTARNNTNQAAATLNGNRGKSGNGSDKLPIIPGVAAERVAFTSSSLDPTLDQVAMRRTESLLYSGTGRNIFSMTYTPVVVDIPGPKVPPRPQPIPQPPIPQPPLTCPPSCPPINLKFFGTATRANGQRQAFLLQGEDVYLASTGDIVARKYKIGPITPTSVQVTDLQTNFVQNLPYQQQQP